MALLASVAKKIRSKNAGPFWVSIDLFFSDESVFQKISSKLDTAQIAKVLHIENSELQRYDLADIQVIKFSFPRPLVQGSRFDRDMHGAQYAFLLSQIEIAL